MDSGLKAHSLKKRLEKLHGEAPMSTGARVAKFFASVPRETTLKLKAFYQVDFDLFGYDANAYFDI